MDDSRLNQAGVDDLILLTGTERRVLDAFANGLDIGCGHRPSIAPSVGRGKELRLLRASWLRQDLPSLIGVLGGYNFER